MGHVGADVHQVRYALAALAFSIAFEKLADLEKQHDEHRLWKLRLSPREETDAKCPDGGNRHEEMFVEGLAMRQALGGLLQRVETYK